MPQLPGDDRTHAFEVRQHLIVPEAHNLIALAFQKTRPFRLVSRRPLVLAAIDFDNQTRVVAHKIGDIPPERQLPAEAMAVHLRRSQDSPNASLGVGHVLP
jgi:hypothetical protein